ncbi:carboxylesterase family protein [Actinomadura fulvescens]|uniref:Carboxylesterase/lipase family protein n=1 Tax=Actinomadura fulvescens TaxID=46160 RepID=A0ABN3QLR0_9ACTN
MASGVVETSLGRIRGRESQGVRTFLGVPYADSTAGPARFRPPRPHPRWTGVRDATEFGQTCPQPPLSGLLDARPSVISMLPLFGVPTSVENQGEQCLVLNIWTSCADADAPRPVLVWLHGGANFGAGDWPRFNGSALARDGGLVVVTLNHRVGILGHLDLSWTGVPGYEHSGNAGILDLRMALGWLRDNVAAFGGDPGNITVAGGSRGASRLATLLATGGEPPFHKAIMVSPPPPRSTCPASPQEAARGVLDRLGIPADRPDLLARASVKQLLDVNDELERAQRWYRFQPVVDGAPVEARAYADLAAGVAPTMPLLIGSALNETTRVLDADPGDWDDCDDTELAERCSRLARCDVSALVQEYRRLRPDNPARKIAVTVTTDAMYRFPALALASARNNTATAPAYAYIFTGGTGSHGEDVLYFFHNLERAALVTDNEVNQRLADEASGAWITFCRQGRPTVPGVDDWPPHHDSGRLTLLFGNPTRVASNPFAAGRARWEENPSQDWAPVFTGRRPEPTR